MIYEANGVRVWASDLDTNALLQAERTARSEVVIHPVALMADAHVGLGATVGSVIVTPSNALLPAAVGVDIGCGMIAVETDLEDIGNGQPLIVAFGRSVPSGVGKSHVKTTPRARDWMRAHPCPTDLKAIHDGLPERATAQIGSLGSGNHFLEVSTDGDGKVWVVVHSGSRGVGNELARFYIGRARELAQVKGIELEDRDLASLEDDEPEYHSYVDAMLWAQDYALENREAMMDAALDDLRLHAGDFKEVRRIQCHHNFSERGEIDGVPVWITRKGAIRAEKGDLGIIPGSMATATYLVEGLGNPLSYWSSAHGAGRRLSRGQAKRTFTKESLIERMGSRAWNGAGGLDKNVVALLDEHPEAYKDIEAVMEDQSDLVRPLYRLEAIVNYKGV
jgi:tRNA-splicing ligase RtcB